MDGSVEGGQGAGVGGILSRPVTRAALALALLLVLAQFVFRPPWRDEYWALFFSDPSLPLGVLIRERMALDTHPPGYFILLWGWRQIEDAAWFARALNLVGAALGAWVAWRLRAGRERETAWFLALCGTSFWLVFYAAEARMLALVFVGCALLTLIARNALDHPTRPILPALGYAALGAGVAISHFFGSLWVAALGLSVGLTFLAQRRFVGFVAFGVAASLALAPVVAWIVWVRPDQNPSAPSGLPPVWDGLAYAANQLGRGLLVKTMLANVAVCVAVGLGFAAIAARRAEPYLRALWGAIGITIGVAFAIHLAVVAMIKERAFIVLIPALLALAAAAVVRLRPDQTRAIAWARAVPLVAIVSLPLFGSELFKDRERVGAVRALLSAEPACDGASVLIHHRPSAQGAGFPAFYADWTLGAPGGGPAVRLIDVATLSAPAASTACAVKAVALQLPKGETPAHQEARSALRQAGLDLETLEERRFGQGRSLAWVAKR